MERVLEVTRGLIPALSETLSSFGGHLECTDCGRVTPLGDVGAKLKGGWPKCCRHTMTWVTARQLAERKSREG